MSAADIKDIRRARLAELIRRHFDDKQAALLAVTGGNQGELSGILGGTKAFGEKKARKLEEQAKLLPMALDANEGAPFYGAEKVNPQFSADQIERRLNQGSSALAYNPLPVAGDNFELGPDLRPRRYPEISWVQAGMWSELCENFVPDESTAWHQCHIDLGPCGFVVSVRGPSMTAPPGISPSFPDGIKLFVSPDAEVLPGKFVIAVRDGKATFKKLTLVEGDLYLEAINPDWPERYQRVEPGDRFCGVVRHAGFDL